MQKVLEEFKEEFYKNKNLRIDTTKCSGDEFPTLGINQGVTEIGTSFAYDEKHKILVICTILYEEKYFNSFINVNPEIFSVDSIDNAWSSIKERILLDYSLNKLR